jgi:hypothetical protein
MFSENVSSLGLIKPKDNVHGNVSTHNPLGIGKGLYKPILCYPYLATRQILYEKKNL